MTDQMLDLMEKRRLAQINQENDANNRPKKKWFSYCEESEKLHELYDCYR